MLTVTLPIYFTLSGLKTDITQISTAAEGAMIVLVCVIATAGKVIGAGGTALLSGVPFREASAVAILMNTRGLVELIVLNLGLQAGILNTKTFSVMVIMCLFTTFITCPIIECIYPPHKRILVSDPDSHDAGKKRALDDDEDAVDTTEVSVSVYSDVIQLARESNIGVVIDRLEHLQGIMDLVYCFCPTTDDASLAVTLMKFEEPTFTDRDQFIGLYEDRLISVEQESTDVQSLLFPDATKPIPTLIPLSVFVKTMGASIQVYDIKGDPHEFPSELKTLSTNASNNLIIIPWRASTYLERFIWQSLKKVTSTIALYVQVDVAVPSVPDGRQRTKSISSNDGHNNPDFSFRLVPPSGHHTGRPEELHERYQRVIALITGSNADISLCSVILRFIQNPQIQVTIFLTDGRKSFPEAVRRAIISMRKKIENYPNVSLVKLENVMTANVETLYQEVIKGGTLYDLFMHSYIEPFFRGAEESEHVPTQRLRRTNTISAIAHSFLPTEPDVVEFRRHIGVPENVANSNLAHPELGMLGDKLKASGSIKNLLIFHEPLTMYRRRNSVSTTQSLAVDMTTTQLPGNTLKGSISSSSMVSEGGNGGILGMVPFSSDDRNL